MSGYLDIDTSNLVTLTGDQIVAGIKTFSDSISASNLSGTNTGDQDLSGLADIDLSNLTADGELQIADLANLDMDNPITVSVATNPYDYVAPSSGWAMFNVIGNTDYARIEVFNGTPAAGTYLYGSSDSGVSATKQCFIFVPHGTTARYQYVTGSPNVARFYPLKGG